MNGLITDITSIADCPVHTAAIELKPQNAGLVINRIQLEAGQKLHLRYLSVHFLKYVRYNGIGKTNSGLPVVYLGVYHGNFERLNQPAGKPIFTVGSDIPGVSQLDSSATETLIIPGIYSFMLVNNSASSEIIASVTGAARIFDPK